MSTIKCEPIPHYLSGHHEKRECYSHGSTKKEIEPEINKDEREVGGRLRVEET